MPFSDSSGFKTRTLSRCDGRRTIIGSSWCHLSAAGVSVEGSQGGRRDWLRASATPRKSEQGPNGSTLCAPCDVAALRRQSGLSWLFLPAPPGYHAEELDQGAGEDGRANGLILDLENHRPRAHDSWRGIPGSSWSMKSAAMTACWRSIRRIRSLAHRNPPGWSPKLAKTRSVDQLDHTHCSRDGLVRVAVVLLPLSETPMERQCNCRPNLQFATYPTYPSLTRRNQPGWTVELENRRSADQLAHAWFLDQIRHETH